MHVYITPRGWKVFGTMFLLAAIATGILWLFQSGAVAKTADAIRDNMNANIARSNANKLPEPAMAVAPIPPQVNSTPPQPTSVIQKSQMIVEANTPLEALTRPAPVVHSKAAEAPPQKTMAKLNPPPPVLPKSVTVKRFRITTERYSARENLEHAVVKEMGEAYRVADWNDLRQYFRTMPAWLNDNGVAAGEGNSLWILFDGEREWQSSGQYFIISRFDRRKPRDYLAHASIDMDLLCLGSSNSRSCRILAIQK